MIELSRYTCPDCGAVWDAWLEDGETEHSGSLCPDCLYNGDEILGIPDVEETDLWTTDEWGGPQ